MQITDLTVYQITSSMELEYLTGCLGFYQTDISSHFQNAQILCDHAYIARAQTFFIPGWLWCTVANALPCSSVSDTCEGR